MRVHRSLPIPFLILILAGVVSLFSVVANRGPQASTVRNDSLQVQTVEQERIAEFYFRILSWLADITPRRAKPVNARPQPAPPPHVFKSPRQRLRQGRIEFCGFISGQNVVPIKPCAHSLD